MSGRRQLRQGPRWEMACQVKHAAVVMTATHQGSRAHRAQAEKVLSSLLKVAILAQGRTAVQPRLFEVRRLKPAWIVGFPTSQPRQPTRAPAHTREYVRDGSMRLLPLLAKLRKRLGRLGGWQTQHPCGFQPSNLFANPSAVGRIESRSTSGYGQFGYWAGRCCRTGRE